MPIKQFNNSITVMRAFCVAGILFFHIDKKWLPLGYLGVDLFFIISGYLITTIILDQCNNGTFKFGSFYSRRFMRLMPAFYAALLMTLLAAFMFKYHNVEMVELLESSLSSLLFLSNFYFWENTGYFVASANLLENIHHWSLSVEEQFYLIWPVTVFLCTRFFRIDSWVFVLLCILLIGVSIYFTYEYPRPAFYLLPTRVWQFVLGALVAIHLASLKKNLTNIDSFPFFALVVSIIFIGGYVPDFPHKVTAITLIISLAMIFFLSAGKDGRLMLLLQNRFIIWLGLASYSLYLVHQPVLAIMRKMLRHPDVQGFWFIASSIFLILSAGMIVYLIETYFRYKVLKARVMIFSHLSIIALFSLIYFSLPSNTINSKFADPSKFDYGCEVRTLIGCEIENGHEPYDARILLLGNSHARMLLPAFKSYGENFYLLHPDKFTSSVLGGKDDMAIQLTTPEVAKTKWLNYICDIAQEFDITVISYRYVGYLYKTQNVHINPSMINPKRLATLEERLADLANCVPKLYVVGPVPELDFWPRNVFRKNVVQMGNTLDATKNAAVSKPINQILDKLEIDFENVIVFKPSEVLCEDEICNASQISEKNGSFSIYYDDDHLNTVGSKFIALNILQNTMEN